MPNIIQKYCPSEAKLVFANTGFLQRVEQDMADDGGSAMVEQHGGEFREGLVLHFGLQQRLELGPDTSPVRGR